MAETSSRLLELLAMLQARRDWPGAELCERLGVSRRTIRRDVERLRELGYPVESLRGPAGGYRLRAGTAMPPLLLDDDEAIAIAVGLRTAARASVEGIEETSVRALVKLEQVLPAHLRRRVTALGSATIAGPVAGPTVDPQHLTVIASACRELECIRFAYEARDGARDPPRGRTPLARQPRQALVSRRLGSRARGLAQLPRRPPGQAGDDRRSLPATPASREGRRGLCAEEHRLAPESLRGAGDPEGAAEAVQQAPDGHVGNGRRRSAPRPASTAPETTISTGWRCGWRCSASTSRCTNRRS